MEEETEKNEEMEIDSVSPEISTDEDSDLEEFNDEDFDSEDDIGEMEEFDEELDPEDELFRENPLKAIWLKLKEINDE